NVYGPYQSLSNPYTGVLAIFAARYLHGRPPLIYEDGEQRRDFVSVHDVARASRLACESAAADGEVFNIGSGQARSINAIAEALGEVLRRSALQAKVIGRYRVGDVRHCFADIGKARRVLGYEPRVSLAAGLAEMADWLATVAHEQPHADRVEQANEE